MDLRAYTNCVYLDFIRPGRPVENGDIESFNGRLRDECLHVKIFSPLPDPRHKLTLWLHDYKNHRPRLALADRTPTEFAAICSGGNSAVQNVRGSRNGVVRSLPCGSGCGRFPDLEGGYRLDPQVGMWLRQHSVCFLPLRRATRQV